MLEKKPRGQKIIIGRSYLLNDFRPNHLLINYKLFKDKLAKFYLNNDLKAKNIKLIKMF